MAKRGRPRHPDILTPREWEVLALLREGLSNDQIAEHLGTSERTARYHVSEILSKLGVSTRQEAAAWEPAERRAWWAGLLLWRRGTVSWLSNGIAGGVAVAVIAAAVVAIWALRATSGGDVKTTSLGANGLTPVPTFPGVDHLMIALDDNADPVATGTNGLARLVDTTSGQMVGEVKAGYEPEALLRRSKSELLVSQTFGAGPANDRPSLSVYALGDLTSPLATIELPGRPSYIIWSASMVLSNDERYLYYPAIDSAATKRNCPSGGDGAVCTVWQIGVVDLDRMQVVAQTIMVTHCGPQVRSVGDADVVAICQDPQFEQFSTDFVPGGIETFLITPTGQSSKLATFPSRRAADQLFSPMYAGTTATGQRYLVYSDGALFVEGNDAPIVDLLPDSNTRFGFNTGASLGTDKYLLAYGDRSSSRYTGLLIFDTSDPTTARSFTLPALVDHVAPVNASQVALLSYGQVDMQIFDVQTASVTRQVSVPADTKWLIGP